MPENRDIQHALVSFASTFQPYNKEPLTKIAQFSNGIAFAQLLITVDTFTLEITQLNQQSERWIDKLTNLKKIQQKIEEYMKQQGRSLKTQDIDLIQIAKHDSSQDILRFFELVISVFMHSSSKQHYIQTIMQLDQRSQQALVVIVQNAIDQRLDHENHATSYAKVIQRMHELSNQNQLLREEIQQLTTASDKYKQQVLLLRQRLEEIEFCEDTNKPLCIDATIEQLKIDNQQLKSMNQNLKRKLIMTVREHQEQLSRFRQQNLFLHSKQIRFKEYEQLIEQLKEQLIEVQTQRDRALQQQKQKRRLARLLQEKQATIAKLKEKLEELSDKNYTMQEHELYMKMELQKKQVRFKQLQKQLKNDLNNEATHNSSTVIQTVSMRSAINEEQMDYMQGELDKLRVSHRQIERQNMKLRKKLQKVGSLQAEKKKLQKIILDVSKSKDAQIEMLIVSLYDLRTENIKMHQLLTKET